MLWSFGYFVLFHPTPLRSQAFVAMNSIMLAMGSVGREKLACATMVQMKHLERSYSTFCRKFPIFCPLSPHPPVFTCICGNAIHYACDGVCGSREACMRNNGSMKHLERSYSTLCCSASDI